MAIFSSFNHISRAIFIKVRAARNILVTRATSCAANCQPFLAIRGILPVSSGSADLQIDSPMQVKRLLVTSSHHRKDIAEEDIALAARGILRLCSVSCCFGQSGCANDRWSVSDCVSRGQE
jgi:hypothetical protein